MTRTTIPIDDAPTLRAPRHSPTYTPEIDGMRAIAVTAVVIQHAFPAWLSGGYVGVDIFFVISGFLIARILINEMRDNRFSLPRFYVRRATRILPALFVVLCVTSAGVLWLFAPIDIQHYGESLSATSVFLSNFYFLLQTGYFAPKSETLPLLHTWSLAVEEQFYILFPLALWFAFRLKRVRLLIVLGLLASFAAAAALVFWRSEPVFYLLPTRAWELLLGCSIAATPFSFRIKSLLTTLLGLVGLSLILASMICLNQYSTFPGATALPTCAGTALIIVACTSSQSPALTLILANPLMRYVGAISYSWYLWHWPALSLLRYATTSPTSLTIVSAVGVSFVLASLTWWFVERAFHRPPSMATSPHRKAKKEDPRTAIVLVSAALSIVFLFSSGIAAHLLTESAFAARIFGPQIVQYSRATEKHKSRKQCRGLQALEHAFADPDCVLGDNANPRSIALWGDSYSDALIPALEEILHERSAIPYIMHSCPSVLRATRIDERPGYRRIGQDCKRFNLGTAQSIAANNDIETVILFSAWSSFYDYPGESTWLVPDAAFHSPTERTDRLADALIATVQYLTESGKNVIVVGTYYGSEGLGASSLIRRMRWDREAVRNMTTTASQFDAFSLRLNARLARLEDDRIVFVDPKGIFCRSSDICEYIDGEPLLSDGSHLSRRGATLLAERISDAFERRGWAH